MIKRIIEIATANKMHNQSRSDIRRRLLAKRTKAELYLGNLLRAKWLWTFEEQKPIGRYFVDFFLTDFGLAIELDGGIHEYKIDYDSNRQSYITTRIPDYSLTYYGLIRFDNDILFNYPNEVLESIEKAIEQRVSKIRRFGRYEKFVKVIDPNGKKRYIRKFVNGRDLRNMEKALIRIEEKKHYLNPMHTESDPASICRICIDPFLKQSLEASRNGMIKLSLN